MNRRRIYERNGIFAWSNSSHGTASGLVIAEAAQQIDLSRDICTSFLDFISIEHILTPQHLAHSLKATHSVAVDFRLNAVAWSALQSEEHPSGLIVGGGESGLVYVFDASTLTKGDELKRVGETRYHQGHVCSVDVSTVNSKWVCTGGALGCVLIWDMNSPLNPMSPGTSNFNNQIKCVGWNHCAESILGSLSNERCSIWDLRRPGSPIFDIADIGGGIEWSVMRWSPTDGTQLCLASQNDTHPIVQKWDLRYTSAPLLSYQLHSRGIFAMDWNSHDNNLLATVGRDEQILLQNPNNGQLVGRIVVKGWARQLEWNPINPNLFAVSFFDRPLEIHSLVPFATNDHSQTQVSDGNEFELSVIPEWMKSGSCGVHFSYGNKICTFELETNPQTNTTSSIVSIKNLEEDKEIGEKVEQLQNALDSNQLSSYCEYRANTIAESSPIQRLIWLILAKQSLNSSRNDYLQLLLASDDKNGTQKRSMVDDEQQLNSVIEQMSLCQMQSEREVDSSEDENINAERHQQSNGTAAKTSPILGGQISEEDDLFLSSLCDGKPQKAIAAALLRKEWTLALLLAQVSADANTARYIAKQIGCDAQSSSNQLRIAALMASGMWEELLYCWNINDWKRLLLIILSMAPPNIIRLLSSKLCERMMQEDGGDSVSHQLEASIPAIIAGNIDSLMDATVSLELEQRIAIAVVLRHSLGAGSARTIAVGAKFQDALEQYAKHLAEKGFIHPALKLVEPFENNDCTEGLTTLRYTLYNVCGVAKPLISPPTDPFASTRQRYSKLGAPHVTSAPQSPGYGGGGGMARPIITQQPLRYSSDDRRQSIDQHSPSFTQQQSTYYSNPGMMPPAMAQPSPYQQSYSPQTGGYWSGGGGYIPQPSTGYTPLQQQTQPQPPLPPSSFGAQQPIPSSALNGPMAPPPSNGHYPLDAYGNQIYSSTYTSGYSSSPPPPPPPPPAAPYGSLPGGGTRIRTTSTASHSSVLGESLSQENVVSGSPVTRRISSSSGWNDPPVVSAKKTEVRQQIAEIHWKPAPIDESMTFNALHAPPQKSDQQLQQQQQQQQSSISSTPAQPTYTLSEADNYLVTTINNLIANIRQVNRTPLITHKMADVEHKVSVELVPRLARMNFSQETLAKLYQMAGLMSRGDFRQCQAICGELVRGNDFVELSAVIPALKVLSSTAQQVYAR